MISIIVPVLDEEPALASLLPELTELDGEHELIVADGGSSDGSVALAGRFGTVIKTRRGRAAQMNAGAAIAQGGILLFLHADTRLPAGALPALESALQDPSIAGGRFRVRLDDVRPAFRIIGAMINIRDAITKGFTGDQAIFVRKTVFREIGGYADMPLLEDLDMARRLRRAGRVIRIPLAVETSTRRWREHGIVRTVLLMWWIRLLYLLGSEPSVLADMYERTVR